MNYQDIFYLDLEKYLKKRQDIIVPFGSVESHGPPLPNGTDTFAIEGIMSEFSKKNQIMIAPTVQYAITRSIENMPGTVTLDFETAKNYFKDIFSSLARWGFKKIYAVTYHASVQHTVSISEAAREANKTCPAVKFIGIHLWNILRERGKEEKILEATEEVHAGEIETSLMLYFRPKLVKKSKIVDEKIQRNRFDFINPLKFNKSGVYGQAKLASKAKGRKLTLMAVRELAKIIRK